MPRRKTTRTDDRARRIAHERKLNAAEDEAEAEDAVVEGHPDVPDEAAVDIQSPSDAPF